MPHRFILLFAALVLFASTANAEKAMIKTMVITPPDAGAVKDNAKPTETNGAAEDTPNVMQSATTNEVGKKLPYFAPTNQLTRWPHLQSLYLPASTTECQTALKALASEPELVPPQGWLQAATLMVDQGRMAEAALYHQLGMLRAAFDAERFPDTPARKTYLNRISKQAESLNEPVYRYMLESPVQMEKILTQLVTFDKATRYAYDPGFPFPAETRMNKIGLRLVEVRKTFITRWIDTAKTLWPQQAGGIYKNLSKILDK